MVSQRYRPFFVAGICLLAAWLLVWGGYVVAKNSKVTAEKIRAYLATHDLNKLSGDARKKALRDLAAKINALSPEERRQSRIERLWAKWFEEMTEQEKADFIEATLPSGLKQMLAAFEELPQEKRKRTVDNAVKRLKEARENFANQDTPEAKAAKTNSAVSEELQKKMVTTGLKTFYSERSAQTKAELAPLLEELQHSMESGAAFRGR